MPPTTTTPEIDELLAANAPVAIGVSGGKDSSAVAFATCAHLDAIGHTGPRILVHSDLGTTEWKQSLEWCQKLATRLGLELLVVKRQRGDMMDRWEQRWSDNCKRYANLECVQLILPWSTPGMRFCTSEMKIDIICRELSKRFQGQTIVSANGIRRQESTDRAKQPIAKQQPKLSSVTRKTTGIDWHPIIDWSLAEVLQYLEDLNFPLHPAYLLWNLTRVSCVFCIMSSKGDLANAARCPENHAIYRRMVRLEIASTFAFGSNWLGDVAPDLLSEEERTLLAAAKVAARLRQDLEKQIPKDMLYVKGWPHSVPTLAAATDLAEIRRKIASYIELPIKYTTGEAVLARYQELWQQKQTAKPARKKKVS